MGLEFLNVFEEWANHYDKTVYGQDKEYKDVFEGYDELLTEVVRKSNGIVLEFGVGTGNLTIKLINNGNIVIGIEPSEPMREIAKSKLPDGTVIYDGDFLNFPNLAKKIDTIVSTYAFHHLNDNEKDQALSLYSNILSNNGKIVFADTAFETVEAYKHMISFAKRQGFYHLAKDLQTEYYPTIPVLTKLFEKNGFCVQFKQWNKFVWVMEATKQ